MSKAMKSALFLLLASLVSVAAIAQSQPSASAPTPVAPAAPVKHYKAEFVVKEVDGTGHVVNNRSYSTILAATNDSAPNQIRSGDRVPIRVDTEGKGNIQYVDVGVNIDCNRIREEDQRLAMSIKVEVTSLPPGTDLSGVGDPLIRQFRWNSDVLITPGTPTTIFSSDDVGSKSKIQLEVTAIAIK